MKAAKGFFRRIGYWVRYAIALLTYTDEELGTCTGLARQRLANFMCQLLCYAIIITLCIVVLSVCIITRPIGWLLEMRFDMLSEKPKA